MLQRKLLNVDSIRGAIFYFPEVGDILPLHTHDETNAHITICARGRLRVFSNQFELEISAGEIWDWEPHVWHGFEALEPNSRIFNITKDFAVPNVEVKLDDYDH
jgi:quercetin dioxygenase-like cupin family protein